MKLDVTAIKDRVLEDLEGRETVTEEALKEIISKRIWGIAEDTAMDFYEMDKVENLIFNSLKRLDCIEELMADPLITEIMINGPNNIFYEKAGRVYKSDLCFDSEESLLNVIEQIVGEHNRRVNIRNPIVDTRLADGSRVHVVLRPISLDGPIVTIRRFLKEAMDMEFLMGKGSLTREAADFLRELVRRKRTLLISGGTGSGKTTLLNALSLEIPRDERIITVEDSAELTLQDCPNLVRMECRDRNEDGSGEVNIRDLIKASLRMRPDRVIVGEVRGAEALDLMQALNTGHQGSLSTIHANSCKDTFSRLETMMLMAIDIPLVAVRAQIASGIEYVVHTSRIATGARVVDEIVKVKGMEGDSIVYETIFLREEDNELKRVISRS